MESKIRSYTILKYIMLFYVLLQLSFLINLYFLNGLYLNGNVMLGVEDVRGKCFSVDIPFKMSHTNFYPEHHFACMILWKEVMNEQDLIIYAILENMPNFLAILLCLYVFQLCRNAEKIAYFLQKILPLVFVVSLFLEFLSNIGSENYKITFFQKYFHFESSNWYLYNEVISKPEGFPNGPLMAITILLISFQSITNQTNKTQHNV